MNRLDLWLAPARRKWSPLSRVLLSYEPAEPSTSPWDNEEWPSSTMATTLVDLVTSIVNNATSDSQSLTTPSSFLSDTVLNLTSPTIVAEPSTFHSTLINASSIDTRPTPPELRIHHPALAIFLGMICVIVVFGNLLTMLSIYRERYLQTVTNYFVASLAAADCLVGAVVMPFSMVHEVMNKWWVFGQDW